MALQRAFLDRTRKRVRGLQRRIPRGLRLQTLLVRNYASRGRSWNLAVREVVALYVCQRGFWRGGPERVARADLASSHGSDGQATDTVDLQLKTRSATGVLVSHPVPTRGTKSSMPRSR